MSSHVLWIFCRRQDVIHDSHVPHLLGQLIMIMELFPLSQAITHKLISSEIFFNITVELDVFMRSSKIGERKNVDWKKTKNFFPCDVLIFHEENYLFQEKWLVSINGRGWEAEILNVLCTQKVHFMMKKFSHTNNILEHWISAFLVRWSCS